ncbi:hypothetical protein BC938DRAFT_475970 [Jimgerdemannia flammicorona]|uniref:Major facilitator superfamily domain-containing protein n=1 Tax=Jimgerdemannia flammicorona TaxID=994334 RepID=A0A433QR49_9FUNG|nr:hypothetical protein BC938DRAFT_475970 [Jimgerdemannia flammicorona]
MFNALNGLGAGGRIGADVSLVDKANSALYSCFAIIGFFAGSVNNILGFKLTLFFGTIGYVVYAGSLWSYDRNQNDAFVIAAGALLGASAGLLWTAQGCVMMSYPEEKDKGKYVSIFWAIFNLGAVLGSIIPLALNIENKSSGGVSDGTYIAFMIIMMFGILLILLLKPPNKVTRDDGTPVTLVVSTDWRSELKSIVLLLGNWRMVLLIPMFLGSNWFYAYQFGINAIYFDVPTRALNGTMYWAAQIFGSIAMGWFLDSKFLNRRGRGLAGLAIMGTLFCGVWAGGLAFQLGFERGENLGVGWSDPRFPGPFVLYFSYGMMDSIYQTYCYWLMGALTNDAAALSTPLRRLLQRHPIGWRSVQLCDRFSLDTAGDRAGDLVGSLRVECAVRVPGGTDGNGNELWARVRRARARGRGDGGGKGEGGGSTGERECGEG